MDIEALKRQMEADHPEWFEPRSVLQPIKTVLAAMLEPEIEPFEDYAKDSWWIMRVPHGAYKTAEASLLRVGIESYAPTYKLLSQMPLRMVPPKKRGNAALYKREVRKRLFEGYLFVRRMLGSYDINRLFDLDGCGGLVTNASSTALVYDYEIELMRLAESDGRFDQVRVETHRGYKVARLPEDGSDQWVGESKIVGRIDSSDKTILLVKRMGRIARLISEAAR